MRAIAAGGWHSVALSVTGDVYGWGWNKHGQLGGSRGEGQGAGGLVPFPRLLRVPGEEEEEDDIVFDQLGAGTSYTAALSSSSSFNFSSSSSSFSEVNGKEEGKEQKQQQQQHSKQKERRSLYVWGRLGLGEATEGRKKEKSIGSQDGGGGGGAAAAAAGILEEMKGEVKMVCGAYHLLLLERGGGGGVECTGQYGKAEVSNDCGITDKSDGKRLHEL